MPTPRRPWPVVVGLVIALLATLAVAIVGWFRPLPPERPAPAAYSVQQVTDAKTKVCGAYERVHNAIKASTSRDRGNTPNEQLVFAINGQQALLAGSVHLRTILSEQPATPHELADAILKLTDLFQELVVEYQNNLPEAEEAPTVRAVDDITLNVERLCV